MVGTSKAIIITTVNRDSSSEVTIASKTAGSSTRLSQAWPVRPGADPGTWVLKSSIDSNGIAKNAAKSNSSSQRGHPPDDGARHCSHRAVRRSSKP